MAVPIIFDCDPGNDDALALLIAMAAPEAFNLLGITTVAGNVSVDKTSMNALKICELAGRTDIPVYAGSVHPMVGEVAFDDAHGASGIDGAVLPDPKMPLQDAHAVDFIIDTILSHKQPVTMLLTGPLTNVAAAITKDPAILKNIAEFVIMGGSMTSSNITPAAEFNFYCDPYSAKAVLECGIKTTLMTLDVTHQLIITPSRIKSLRSIGNNQADQIANMMEATQNYDIENFGLEGRAIHDACVPIYILHPELFKVKPAHIHIETAIGERFGHSNISLYPRHLPKHPWLYVSTDVDAESAFNKLIGWLKKYSINRK